MKGDCIGVDNLLFVLYCPQNILTAQWSRKSLVENEPSERLKASLVEPSLEKQSLDKVT